ncbi:MAG: ABC transporter permease, partial [Planctomycetales bacterium]|nr:ABC transporter permease [Planctomycetales bacterium]
AALSRAAADELDVEIGDRILLTLPVRGSVPAESTLGEKEETSAARRFRVAAILSPDRGDPLARFSLEPNQQAPRLAFVPLTTLQQTLAIPDKVNALAIGRTSNDGFDDNPDEAATMATALTDRLHPQLSDYGLRVHRVQPGGGDSPSLLQIDSDRLMLRTELVRAIKSRFAAAQPSVVALANRIQCGDRSVPYSTIAGVDSTADLGPLLKSDGTPISLADDEAAINDWTAKQLSATIGDTIEIAYYQPETTHGRLIEAQPLRLRVAAIVPLQNDDGTATRALDPELAPELPGVTDQATINDWELPFELVEEIRDVDEEYWDAYRTTPKVFVSLSLAERLWATRWGTITALRLPLPGTPPLGVDEVAETLRTQIDPTAMGFRVEPIRSRLLQAASGTTPFEGLFLGFSFFLLASALMLVSLLFRLGVESRAKEVGLLEAIGLSARRVRTLLAAEGALVSFGGTLLGVVAGGGYAALMIHGLNTWWVAATSAPFLHLSLRPMSLVIGAALGGIASLAAAYWTLRKLLRQPARRLLAGSLTEPSATPRQAAVRTAAVWGCWLGAAALGVAAWRWQGEAQAGAFLGCGALVLVGSLARVSQWLAGDRTPPTQLALSGLAARNARRNPGRTLLSIGLAAAASFLLIGLGAFRLDPSEAGGGGFDLLATSDVPVHVDLATADGRRDVGFSQADNAMLEQATVVGFRVQAGEDASCLNLYQTSQPRILGTPTALAAASRFTWGPTAPLASGASPWSLLENDLGRDAAGKPIVPMILDQNTAMYSLKLYRVGDQFAILDGSDQPTTLQVVGMLAGSVLQGDLLIGEEAFTRLFPNVAGKQFFLIRSRASLAESTASNAKPTAANADSTVELSDLLERQLEDFGFDVRRSDDRLAELMAVQNTYLTTFQTLGGLGLLLGAVGLAVAQLRSVIERRGELALLRAIGFSKTRLATLVLAENASLLAGGLAIGCLAAAAAVWPHAVANQTTAPWSTLAGLLAATGLTGGAASWMSVRAALG